uniref:Uncharacterized protein n=1 Tax=Oryza sativa subsp. japonica TaxID=39947 RepID=Q10MB9_ORYSJ|nr:hypothetical protein LOC_Os03g20040 [Oryza sativa Japonica Group]
MPPKRVVKEKVTRRKESEAEVEMVAEEGAEPSAPVAEDGGALSASAPAPSLLPSAPATSAQVLNAADMAKAAAAARALQTRRRSFRQANCWLSRSLPKYTLNRLAKCHKQWQNGLRLCRRSSKLSFSISANPTAFQAQAVISPFATPYPQQGAVNRARAEKRLSLSGGIKTHPIPPQFKFPPVQRYSGKTDPKEFLSIYESAIEAADGDENTKAKGQPPRQGQAPMTWRKFRTDRAGKAVMAVEEVQALCKEFDTQQASNHQQPIRKKVRKDLYCAFHGRSSHTTEQCRNIRQRGNVQDLRPQQGAAVEAPREAAEEQAPPAE